MTEHTYETDTDIINNYPPAMWLSEISSIILQLKQREKNKINILEWGSGNSTIFFSHYLRNQNIAFEWTSIEHYTPWYNKVKQWIQLENLTENIDLHLLSQTDEPDKKIQQKMPMDDYVNFPSVLNKKFDLILIDGRKRSRCLQVANKVLKKDKVVFLHDAEKPWYHKWAHLFSSGEYVTENLCEQAVGGVQKLWMGKKNFVRG